MEIGDYIAGYKLRLAARRRELESAREALLERARGLAGFFDGLPGLRRVYLFGSAARSGSFEAGSDIDLGFEGLPAERFCETLSQLVDRLDHDVDAVRLEDTGGPLREQILGGIVIYERRAHENP